MNLKYTEPPFFGLSTAKRRQLQKFLSTELKYFNRLYSKKHFTSISENSIIEYTVHRSMSNNETSDYNI